jgi:hypothetical protein
MANLASHRWREVVDGLKDHMSIRVLYLGDGPDIPSHWGRAVNPGIQASRNEIISVMDGDVLV